MSDNFCSKDFISFSKSSLSDSPEEIDNSSLKSSKSFSSFVNEDTSFSISEASLEIF